MKGTFRFLLLVSCESGLMCVPPPPPPENRFPLENRFETKGRKMIILSSVQVVFCFAILQFAAAFDASEYEKQQSLSPKLTLHWRTETGDLHFALVANSLPQGGWIGFGIAPTGQMVDSDVMLAAPGVLLCLAFLRLIRLIYPSLCSRLRHQWWCS